MHSSTCLTHILRPCIYFTMKFQKIVSSVWRTVCSCTSGSEMCGHASHSNTPYRQLNPLNKEGVPIIEKAEMLDPEDRAWV